MVWKKRVSSSNQHNPPARHQTPTGTEPDETRPMEPHATTGIEDVTIDKEYATALLVVFDFLYAWCLVVILVTLIQGATYFVRVPIDYFGIDRILIFFFISSFSIQLQNRSSAFALCLFHML
jgi:hypothetical protein